MLTHVMLYPSSVEFLTLRALISTQKLVTSLDYHIGRRVHFCYQITKHAKKEVIHQIF